MDHLSTFYRDQLVNDCLPFWLENAVDRQYGGFMTSLNRDGSVLDTDKGVWQQGRFTWLLAKMCNDPLLANEQARSEWLDIAVAGGDFLREHGFDASDGRMWFHLDRQGHPIRKRRYAFSESFAAIAFGELAKATDQQAYRDLAVSCFEEFLSCGQDSLRFPPKWTSQRTTRSIGPAMIRIGTAQQLRESIGLETAAEIIDQAILEIKTFFVKPDLQCVMETVSETGEILDHFDGRTLNPGHAIEAGWFILEEARVRKDSSLIDLGCQILDWMLLRGWDEEYGGILYFVDVKGLPVQEYWHDMKFWWPHNEAIICSLYAYLLTGEEKYKRWHQRIHDWSFDHFADPEFGEWFGYLHRDGTLSVPLKGNLWKGPFHYPRMLLTCWKRLQQWSESGKLA